MTNIELERRIKQIRPALRLVAPLTFFIMIGFAALNIFIGASLFDFNFGLPLVVAGIISLHAWSAIFITHGLLILSAIQHNSWAWLKRLLLVGVTIKTIWLFELISLAIRGGSPFFVFVWSFLLYLQISTYIYFAPPLGKFLRGK